MTFENIYYSNIIEDEPELEDECQDETATARSDQLEESPQTLRLAQTKQSPQSIEYIAHNVGFPKEKRS